MKIGLARVLPSHMLSLSDSLEICQISNITNIKEQLEEIECLLGLVGSEIFFNLSLKTNGVAKYEKMTNKVTDTETSV